MSSMLRIALALAFLALPLLEIAVLIEVGQTIGVWPTLGLLVAAAFLGMIVIREQGLAMVGRMFAAASDGRMTLAPLIDAYAGIVAGFLLIIPGFISDIIGLLLLVPPLRRWAIAWSFAGFTAKPRAQGSPAPTKVSRSVVIETTYERIEDPRDDAPR
jgi:UPF0716 family protein affecting phage T7 exclusion